jgi:energy-coupling factor transporter ATP-binding protein EcfA2
MIAVGLFLGDLAIEVLAPDVGKLIENAPNVKRLLWGLVILCLAAAIFRFIREHDKPGQAAERQDDETGINDSNRRVLLKQVRRNWIEGVLYKSLWNEARLVLNLDGRPDAVVRPCDLALRRAGKVDTYIQPGTSILDVYRAEQEELLLLGEPGSGKTTLLLHIAEGLLQDAENDSTIPVPVIFNLSPWRKNNARLNEWLVDQLNQDYGIPKKTAQRWVDAGELLLLLDGLDEVPADCRAACVEAINSYRLEHQRVLRPMVVCCRTREYDEIPKLRLNAAVIIQPLTKQQVDSYLKAGGKALAGLRAVLKDEPTFYQELFSTPLMLHVAVMSYAGQSAAELRHSARPEELRRRLWDVYIERMFERKLEKEPQYEMAVALSWLSWLGLYLKRKNLQRYLMEAMQPNDLPRRWQAFLVRWSLFIPMFTILLFFLRDDIKTTFFTGYPKDLTIRAGLGMFIILALVLVFSLSALVGLWYRPTIELQPVRRLSLQHLHRRWKFYLLGVLKEAVSGAIPGAVGGAILGAIMTVGLALIRSERDALLEIVGFMARMILTVVLAFGLFGGLTGVVFFGALKAISGLFDIRVPENTVRPNEGIHRSLRIAMGVVFCLFCFLVGVLLTAAIGASHRMSASEILIYMIRGAGILSVVCAMVVAPFFGGRAVFQHYVLRILLWQSGRFPLDITTFLDWTEQRILVRRIGGGWQFVHRTLQERFAERYYEKQ